ncbi:unnamed protein product, partial [Tetraodon nigroviridis]
SAAQRRQTPTAAIPGNGLMARIKNTSCSVCQV